MPSPEPTRPSLLPWVELSVLLAVALGCLGFHLWLPGTSPSEADYQAVARVLAAEQEPGDVVLLHPWWTERARLFLPGQLPVVGYFGSDNDDLPLHPRIWVLAQPRLPRADLPGFERLFDKGRVAVGPARTFGNLTLALFKNGRHRPLRFSAEKALPQARVALESARGRAECTFDGRAHRCPGRAQRVAPEWHELRYQPRRCLWFHPPGGPDRLVAEFPEVPAGTSLVLEGGVVWEHAVRAGPGLTPLRLGLEDARTGQSLATLSVAPGVEGMQRVEAPPLAQAGPVRLWAQSDNPAERESCVDLVGFAPPGEPK